MFKKILTKYGKYLPSKKFGIFLGSILLIGALFFLGINIFSGKKIFTNSQNKLETKSLTINTLLERDSDGDSIMDWEEALWGTNPNALTTFDGIPDEKYIKSKKDELNLINDPLNTSETANLTETDKFSREFFASLSAMKQSGQIDQNTINNVGKALGQKIVDPSLIDKYGVKDAISAKNDDATTEKAYYTSLKKLYVQYSNMGIGDEVAIIASMVSKADGAIDPKGEEMLRQISGLYQEFSTKMISMSVPESLISYHINIANNANNTGVAVLNMVKITSDPVVGLSGLSQYQKYSDDLVSSVGELEAFLLNNGIIF